MRRRAAGHPLAPAVAVALLGLAYLAAAPATADMAGHAYRTALWEREGATVFNAQWYSGHHVAGYSLLFSPLAALLGPRTVGVLAAVAATALFAPLARAAAPSSRAAAWATWLFAGGVLSNVVIGRMPFTLGMALAVAAWAVLGRSRPAAAALALASALASPVAGVFLALAAAARALGGGRRELAPAAVLAGPVLAGGALLAGLFPEGGPDRFVATAFWPMLAVSAAGAALLDPRRRALVAGAVLSCALLAGAFLVPTTFGQNALRLGVVLGPPLLALAPRPGAPRGAIAVVGLALVYLAWLPAVRAVAESRRDPAVARAFHAEAERFLARRVAPGERVEVPLTLNHWEAAHLAPSLPLARGWARQLDLKVNPLFYDGEPLTPARYEGWLRDRAIGWVALPRAPLDYSARAERRVLERGAPYLRLVHDGPGWRIWRVRGAAPPVAGPARMTAHGASGFALRATAAGTAVVRERWTRYWTVTRGAACVRRAGEWTAVELRRPGPVEVRARFSAGRALGRGAACPRR